MEIALTSKKKVKSKSRTPAQEVSLHLASKASVQASAATASSLMIRTTYISRSRISCELTLFDGSGKPSPTVSTTWIDQLSSSSCSESTKPISLASSWKPDGPTAT